jgi:hypothetical protein
MKIIKQYDILASLWAGLGTLVSATAATVRRHRPPDSQSGVHPRLARLMPRQCASELSASKKRQRHGKGVNVVSLTLVSAALMTFAPGMASAQTIDNPPLLPMDITVFPMRDFTSISGFAANADVLVQVRRDGVVSDAVGRTDSTGFLEVNHPGGVCWRTVTPDIVAGDTVRVTYRNTQNNLALQPVPVIGSGAAANTQNVTATQAVDVGDGTVVIKGAALLASGGRIPLNRLEIRIINPDFRGGTGSRITRRDIRADSAGGRVDGINGDPIPGTSGTLTYDSATATTFTAVFKGLNDAERRLAVGGQTRVMGWQQTTAAGDRLGMTIYEVGEFGGPGMGGCPPGPEGGATSVPAPRAPDAPVGYDPAALRDASVVANQVFLKDVTVFPERDFVSIEGYPAGTNLQVVVRRGSSTAVGTASGTVGSSGTFEVNHPGGVCWSGQTPDIQPGDWIDVFTVSSMSFSEGQKQRVINTKVTKPAFITNNVEVRVNGTAVDANGQPLPLRLMEQRIINPDFGTTRIGRRDIRADVDGGRTQNIPGGSGSLLRTGTGNEWRAVYLGLTDAERRLAKDGQSRAMAWHSTNGNGDRFGLTISEFGEVGGPGMGGCPAAGSATISIPGASATTP